MIFVVGGRGRLGKAISASCEAGNVALLERNVYSSWSGTNARDEVSRYFDAVAKEGDVVYVTSGLLDPGSTPDSLRAINFLLPRNIIDGVAKLGIKVVTFGTMMEGVLTRNAYVQSKTALGDYVAAVASTTNPVAHLRIHTLYGFGEPSPFMFLGQMLEAIRNDTPFEMTRGRQLREYHHLQDEAAAIRKIDASSTLGVVDLSHGQPVTLKAIAEYVFARVGKQELLRIGALPEPTEETFERICTRPAILDDVRFRDALPAILDYIQACLAGQADSFAQRTSQ